MLKLAAVVCVLAGAARGEDEKPDPLAAMNWIVGDWTGVGEGQPGVSSSQRHATRIQGGKFIMVEGTSVYPKQEKNPKGEVHTSIDIWSFDRARAVFVMRQFDSLGFVSTYVQDKAASTPERLVLASEHLENVPTGWTARYSYIATARDEYQEIFELSTDATGFKPYVTGKFLRTNP
jgi:hypothetical protein